MIPPGIEIIVGLDPIDLRWSFDRLAGIALESCGLEPRCGALFVFFGKRRTALKAILFHHNGFLILYKRLDKGTYRLPEPLDPHGNIVAIDVSAFEDLLDGIDIEKPHRKKQRRVQFH